MRPFFQTFGLLGNFHAVNWNFLAIFQKFGLLGNFYGVNLNFLPLLCSIFDFLPISCYKLDFLATFMKKIDLFFGHFYAVNLNFLPTFIHFWPFLSFFWQTRPEDSEWGHWHVCMPDFRFIFLKICTFCKLSAWFAYKP